MLHSEHPSMLTEQEEESLIKALEDKIGYTFKERAWIWDACTHRSFVHEWPERARSNNERLEFLGDSIVGVVASSLFFKRMPDVPEGELTRKRAELICENSLCQLALKLNLDAMLRLGRGEEKTKGREKPRLLASAFEALVAAMSMDSSTQQAMAVTQRLLEAHLDSEDFSAVMDHKSQLQEWLQSGKKYPKYHTSENGAETEGKGFVSKLEVLVLESAKVESLETEAAGMNQKITEIFGNGKSKAEAERMVAKKVLDVLREDPQGT